jgi:hypothetical protein
LTSAVSDAGICPVAGDTLNHAPPVDVVAVAVHVTPDVPAICSSCACGDAPCGIWNVSDDGVTVIAGGAVTVRVTVTVSCGGDASGFEIAMLPV